MPDALCVILSCAIKTADSGQMTLSVLFVGKGGGNILIGDHY